MPRISNRRKRPAEEEEEETFEDAFVVKEDEPETHQMDQMQEDVDEAEGDETCFTYTQTQGELSQAFPVARASERNHLNNLTADQREKLIQDLSRMVLFRALAGQPIDRLKCCKAVGVDKCTNAVFEEVKDNLENVFGFQLKKYPTYMKDSIAKKYEDRYFCTNAVTSEKGSHEKAIHATSNDAAIEKGFLVLVLSFIFCAGEVKQSSRWLTEPKLFHLLHSLDENLPADPPNRKTKTTVSSTTTDGIPNPDVILEKLVNQDYLLREKETDANDLVVFSYSMGPRASLEVGRAQIIHSCAQILDESPDPTMLAALEQEVSQETQ